MTEVDADYPEDVEAKDFIEMLDNMMPELKLEQLETNESHLEEISLALKNAEEKIVTLVDSLDSVAKLYADTRAELSAVKIKQDTLNDAGKAANYNLAQEIVKSLKIDYDMLTTQVISQMCLDKEVLTKRLEAKYQKMSSETSIVSKISEKVKEAIEGDLEIDYDGMEIEYGTLIEHIDYDNIAYNICYSTLSDYLSFDPTDYWDASDLAEYFDADDIAEYVNAEEVAEHLDTDAIATEVDLDDIAQRINAKDVATHIDLDELALFLSQNIDLDDLAQRVKGDEE